MRPTGWRRTVPPWRRTWRRLAASPGFARAFLIEVLGAGPDALSRRAAVQDRFAAQLRDVHRRARADIPAIPEVAPHTFLAAVGAVNELVTAHVLEHGAQTLPELADAILDVQLALLVGRQMTAELAANPDDPTLTRRRR